MYRADRTPARPPAIARAPDHRPLSRATGATPTRAAIRFRDRVPSSGSSVSRVRLTTRPTPGAPRSRSSLARQTGLASIAACNSPPTRASWRSSQVTWSRMPRGDGRRGQPESVLLGGPHLDELPAAGDQGGQGPGVGIGQRADRGGDGLGEVGQGGGVQPVGLGQPAGGPGEVPGLPGVDDHDREAGRGQGGGEGGLVPAGRLQDDAFRAGTDEPGIAGVVARLVGTGPERLPGGPEVDVEVVLADIDADEHGRPPRGHPSGPALRIRCRSARLFGLRGREGCTAYPAGSRWSTKHTRAGTSLDCRSPSGCRRPNSRPRAVPWAEDSQPFRLKPGAFPKTPRGAGLH